MVKKRPQLNADDLGRLRWGLGCLLALLSVVTVFFMEIDAWVHMPMVAFAAVLGLAKPTWPGGLSVWVHRMAFPFIVVVFVLDLVMTREPLPALIRLDLLLILYRLITYRQRRDDLQLVLLGLFLIIVAGVITVSLSFAVQLLAFTSCALVMLLAVTLEHADGTSPPPVPAGVVPNWARGTWGAHLRKLRAATDWRLATLGVLGFGAMVVVSGLLFLAIPRFDVQSSLFIDRLINRTTRTGFSDNIRFGEVTEITQDNSLAFQVDLADPSVMPGVPYWRMVVLDEYTGEGFRMSDAFRRELNGRRPPRQEIDGAGRFYSGAPEWTIYMEAGISRYLPLLGNFYRIRFTEPQTFTFSSELRILALQRDPPKMFAYRPWSMDTSGELKDATYALKRRDGRDGGDHFTGLPADPATQARLHELSTEIGAAGDARDFANRAVTWLGDLHPYSLTSSVPAGSGDTLLRWLDSETPGHCEFFAGSFVLLARSAGYPARMVTGFRGGTWNDFSNSFTVRNANAHAWCEIFDIESGAWIRVDPTPGNQALADQANDPASAAAMAARRDNSWQARLESLRVFWYRRIVNFDDVSQQQLLSDTKQFFRKTRERLVSWADAKALAVRSWLQQPWDLQRFWTLIYVAAGLTLAIWLWRTRGRRWWFALRRHAHRRHPAHDPVRREAGRWLQRGARRTDFGWPPEIEAALLRLRYGAAETWPDPLDVFRSARRALRRA